METKITSENFKSIWESILIKATDKYKTPPEVIQVSNSTISTLGNFSASTGKGKSKKTFNVCAIVAAALTGKKVLNYEANFPENKNEACILIQSRVHSTATKYLKESINWQDSLLTKIVNSLNLSC